ncbi:hypothetical protein [Jeongeupia naejangsanensis]|uniref:Uncharacterized protein n=1 Tax=Jeongeupia naejangsanensis TaxID=613195 RepID=A0ABS2BG32_9NEIS|nr:hypothetical protein [Jeongeupia naejangsanensis]MBM3114572.1 hypothetical protein [Jeongeupia naejangsanensis]
MNVQADAARLANTPWRARPGNQHIHPERREELAVLNAKRAELEIVRHRRNAEQMQREMATDCQEPWQE